MNNKFLLVILVLVAVSTFVGCNKDNPEDWVTPTDEAPAIALISPAQNNFVKYRGEVVTATFRLDDNEQLKNFRVVGQTFDDKNQEYGTEFIAVDQAVTGKHITETFTYTIPNPASLPDYFKVRFTAYAIDTKGAYAEAIIWVSVIPDPILPGIYTIQSYTNGNLYSAKSASAAMGKHRLFFPTGTQPANGAADVQEASTLAGVFSHSLKSPNNLAYPNCFIVTTAQAFNYDIATYETLQQAYLSAPIYYNVTPSLNAGDIVIMKMPSSYNVNGGTPMYAAIRINSVNDDPNGDDNDFMNLDFKYSKQ